MAKAKSKVKSISKKKIVVKAKPKAKKVIVKAKAKKSIVKAKAKPPVKSKKVLAPVKSKTKPAAFKMATLKPSPKARLVDVSDFVTPLDDRIIVQASEGEKITAGGLIIPDTVSTISGNKKGVVLAVGRGHVDKKGRVRPMDVKAGDNIVFPDFTGSKIIYQGQDLIILRETDVMGVLD